MPSRAAEISAPRVASDCSALRERGMVVLSLATVCMGAVFASSEITMVAFCGQHGHRSLSGLVVAMFAAGSGVSGFFYGARTWPAPLLDRYRVQTTIFAGLPAVFLIATNVSVLAVCSFVVGLGIAPMPGALGRARNGALRLLVHRVVHTHPGQPQPA